MAPSSKGKEKVIDDGKDSGKRKRGYNDVDKTGGGKRRNLHILQFFDDAAYEVGEDDQDDSDDSFFDADFVEDEFDTGVNFQKEPSRAPFLPFVPKEEEPTDEELEKMLQERYKPGSNFISYAEDNYESKKSMDTYECWPSVKEPTIWKVKCVVGRERHSAFCLMQKYVDLKYLGKELQILSAFSVDHIKGFIYIEAEKQHDIYEACNGLSNIYSSRVAPVPKDDVSHLFTIRSMGSNISEGMWARVKNGKYKGDLAQVAAVNGARKKVTVKLVPRINLQAFAEKIGRGTTANRAVTPAPRLISSGELEEFRPLIQFRRDRDTNKVFEVLDGMMLKDGYLYKKVSFDSLSFWGVTPTDDELLKFEPSKNDECKDLDWLLQLYGEQKKKRPLVCGKGGGKGDGSSSSSADSNFEVNDLVFFGRKDFGVIIGTEKEGTFKIIKSGSEGPVVVTLQQRDLKNASFDKKLLTALDQQSKNISINDTVTVVEGPLKDREGTVKRIYQGIVFLYNETVEENSGYFCIKAQMCEKVEVTVEARNEKGGEPCPSGFGDFPSSPKSPLSPKQSEQGRDGIQNFKREDDAMFSVGQLLRIRVGPLKGYLCRVLAIRRSDVTVKLDSKHKVLTVKCEHLSEVRAKSSGISLGEDSSIVKPFDLLGTQDGSTDWMDGASKAAEGGGWNAEGFSTGRSTWPAFPASNSSLQPEPESSVPLKAADDEANKGASWEIKATSSQGTSWGIAAAARDTSFGSGQVNGWGNQEDSSEKGALGTGFGSSFSDSWGKAVESLNQTTCKELKEDSWGRAAGDVSTKGDSSGSKSAWKASGVASAKPIVGWGNTGGSDAPETTPWNKATTSNEGQTDSWVARKNDGEGTGVEASAWNQNAGVTGAGIKVQDSCNKPNTPSVDGSKWAKALKSDEGTNEWGANSGTRWSDGRAKNQDADKGSAGCESKLNDGAWSSGWNKKSVSNEQNREIKGQGAAWNKSGVSTGNQASGWGKRTSDSGREHSDWDNKFGAKTGEIQSSGWNSSSQEAGGGGWGGRETPENSKWNKKSISNEQNRESKGQGDAWNRSAVSTCGNQASGWGKKASDSGREHSDGDNKFGAKTPGDIQSSGWNSSSQEAGGGGWGGRETPENSNPAWKTSSSSWDRNPSAAGGGKSNGDSQKTSLVNTSHWDQKSTSSKMDVEVDEVGAWNNQKTSEGGSSSGWGQSKKMDVEVDKVGDWNNKKTSDGGSSSGWGQSKWSGATDAGGGLSSGWGQSNWSGAADARGNENSCSKNTWKSNNNFGSSAEQTDTFNDRGRGGNWRGGRGGRWGQDRGGFRGRGGSERGGFGGEGSSERSSFGGQGSSERGGFGGRGGSGRSDFGGRGRSDWGGGFRGRGGSDGGDFGGRGESHRGGFRGRGGFGGRGRARRDDWNKNDSGEENARCSWNNTSNKDGSWTTNSNGGNWSSGVGDKGKWRSGNSGWTVSEGAAAGGNDAQGGRWNKGAGSSKDTGGSDAQGSDWNREGSNWKDRDISSSEKQDSWKNWSSNTSKGWATNNNGGNWHVESGDKNQCQGAASDWENKKEPAQGGGIEKAGGWSSRQSKDIDGNDGNTGGWNSKESSWKISNSSGVGTSFGWNQPAAGEGAGSATDAWDKGASSSRAQKNDEKGKRGW